MTDTIGNVTELRPKTDPTSAARSRRYRKRKRATSRTTPPRKAAVTQSATEAVTVPQPKSVTVERHGGVTVRAAALCAALGLATCSAAFSITGLTSIFAGSVVPVIGMGIVFELGKLSGVALLGQRIGAAWLRLALAAVVLVLMTLNSIGVYGFLSRAHLEHALAGDLTVASKAADVEARLSVQAGVVADLDRRIGQVDAAVDKSISGGRTKAAMALVEQERKNRAELVTSRSTEAGKLASLKVEAAKVDGERKAVEADLGPVRYLATLLGSTDEQTMRWFILVVALLLDPAAVLLLLAATAASRVRSG